MERHRELKLMLSDHYMKARSTSYIRRDSNSYARSQRFTKSAPAPVHDCYWLAGPGAMQPNGVAFGCYDLSVASILSITTTTLLGASHTHPRKEASMTHIVLTLPGRTQQEQGFNGVNNSLLVVQGINWTSTDLSGSLLVRNI